ncbi:MAG: TolC family outer membrane protein [Proteobacteria bacterium]|nr:TolC family outer membrane protein [Pseudomonadota bacterium]
MKKIKKYLITTLLFTIVHSANAADLVEAYRDAVQSDQKYQAAYATMLSTKQALPIAMAGLLPSLTGTGSSTYNVQNNYSRDPLVGTLGTHNFSWHNYTVSLAQPLFNYSNWKQLSSAKATVKQAVATFNAATQDLMVRTAKAYFDILQAEETLRLTHAQLLANARQLDQSQQRFKVGLDAITSVYNAQASYDAVRAREIAAQNAVDNAKEVLREITGKVYPFYAKLKRDVPLVKPQPLQVEEWVKVSERQNYQILSFRYAVEAAREFIKVQSSSDWPQLNLVGSYNRDIQGSVGFGQTNLQTTGAGVQVNFPLYQGGIAFANTKKARYDHQTAVANMEGTRRAVADITRQTYNNVISGISKIHADKQAIISAQSSLDSTEAALKVGTRTMVDVLLATQNLYQVEQSLAVDQFAFINSTLQLKQAAGTLSLADLETINNWLYEGRTPKPK